MKPASRPVALAVLGRGLVDPDTAVIHADDVGFLRGLAAFETLRVYGGRPFAMPEHLERLRLSALRMHLDMPELVALEQLAQMALAAAGLEECSLRLTVTGGRGDGAGAVAMASVLELPPDLESNRRRGIRLVALQLGTDPRLRRDAPWLLDGVKSTSYAVNMAAWDEARARGADDAVFVAAEGSVLEGPVTNIWWRRGPVLYTPALELGVLAGVTRAYVLQLANAAGYQVSEGWFPLSELVAAEEAFSSSSIRELMPIISIDDAPIGTGLPGEAAVRLQAKLREVAQREGARG